MITIIIQCPTIFGDIILGHPICIEDYGVGITIIIIIGITEDTMILGSTIIGMDTGILGVIPAGEDGMDITHTIIPTTSTTVVDMVMEDTDTIVIPILPARETSET